MKKCSRCKEEKDEEYFGNNTASPDGKRPDCKSCRKDEHRVQWLRITYGMSIEDYEELLHTQDNKCAVCRVDKKHLKQRMAVDHNHDTGAVRGLLCSSCNRGLGYFKDNPDFVLAGYKYLVERGSYGG